MKHAWQFSVAATSGTANLRVVAVCEACGQVRSAPAPQASGEGIFDVSGDCTGEPQPVPARALPKGTVRPFVVQHKS